MSCGYSRRRRGFTLVELMIASAIASLVMVAVATLQYFSARIIKETYGQTRTRSSRMIALDQIRYRLMMAKIGSCNVSSDDHMIQYTDPTVGNVISRFYFIPSQKTLYYHQNINGTGGPIVVAQGPIDVTFEVLHAGEIVQLNVRSASDLAYGRQDVQDGQTSIYLRNP